VRIPFLFWNLKELPLQLRVAQLALERRAVVIILVECTIAPEVIITALDAVGLAGFKHPTSPAGVTGDIKIFIRVPKSELRPLYDDQNNHVTIRRHIIDRSPDMLLAVVHSQSKRNWTDKDQAQGAIRLASQDRRRGEGVQASPHHSRGGLKHEPFRGWGYRFGRPPRGDDEANGEAWKSNCRR